jgi:cyclohexyl-isocyanide hydratase
MNRRAALLLALGAPWIAERALAQTSSPSKDSTLGSQALKTGTDEIALVAYPNMAALDLVAPQTIFAMLLGAKVHVVAKTRDTIVTDTGLSIVPTSTFSECPKNLTVLFVPGGTGAIAPMRDHETLAFVSDRGARASYVTSVCTGALVLGAAGLLKGYRATTHWSVLDVLERFGATSVRERVVKDRNRVTGGGVTAGLDFGLAMVGILRDRFYAQTVQLLLEYDPQPPFDAGSPLKAPSSVVAQVRDILASFIAQAKSVPLQPAFLRHVATEPSRSAEQLSTEYSR